MTPRATSGTRAEKANGSVSSRKSLAGACKFVHLLGRPEAAAVLSDRAGVAEGCWVAQACRVAEQAAPTWIGAMAPSFLSLSDGITRGALASLPLESHIVDALLWQQGSLGLILQCVLEYEKHNWSEAQAAVNLPEDTIRDAYGKALAWSLSTLKGLPAN